MTRKRSAKKRLPTAAEIDAMAMRGDDSLADYVDWENAIVVRRANVDFPKWMIEELDQEATRLNISRQAVIKTWIGDRLEAERRRRSKKRAWGKIIVAPEIVVAHTDKVKRFESTGKKFTPPYRIG